LIVVGYGTQKKANISGAVSVVKSGRPGSDQEMRTWSYAGRKSAGLRVQQMSAEPGSFNTQSISAIWQQHLPAITPPLIIIMGCPKQWRSCPHGPFRKLTKYRTEDASAAIYGVKAAMV